MCGIAGVIGMTEALGDNDFRDIQSMTSSLTHRGPDNSNVQRFSRCILGNTRLNILDLSSNANLPMSNGDGSVWIAYNGEVTNFRDLEKTHRLRDQYDFRTTSDTEVLLALYEKMGLEFCKHLTGMFAFMLYDHRVGKAWLVRDCYGIRPLFFSRMSDRVYFASEIKAFLELPEFIKEVDQDSIYHYFTLGYIPGHRTPFKNIEELRSGHMIEFDLNHGTEKETRYYNIDYTPDLDSSIDGLTEGLLHQMRDSVQRNLISDVPVGVSLSGGFDSASILALAREHLGDKELHTYSIVMEEDSFNESSYQKLMVDFAKTTHHEVRVGAQEIATSLLNHIAFMDEPTSNGGAIPTYLLAAEAKKDVKVLLSGEGGDETFSAYDTYRAWKVRKLYRALVPSFARKGIQMLAHTMPINHQKLSFDFRCKRFTSGAELSVPESHVYWRHALTNTDKSAIMPDYKANTTTGSLFTSLYNEFGFDHELDRISALDIDTFFVGDLMTKNDRMLMAHSVEARFPYMDRKLFDHASKVPADIRLKGLKERYLQKRAMRGRLPKAIINRKKMGLEMPYSKWLLNQLRPQAEHYFSKSQIEKTGFLSHATVQRLWSEHEQKKRDNGRALWSILTFVIWNDLFIQSNSYKQYLR